MKIKFENLGALEYGDVELSDLTVICGENNTGKTYVTYLIYCLLTTWRHLIDIELNQAFIELRRDGVAKIDLNQKIALQWEHITTTTLNKFLAQLPEMLASKSDLFSKLKLTIDFPLGDAWLARNYENELRNTNGNLLIALKKPAGAVVLELAAPKSEDLSQHSIDSLSGFIEERIWGLMLREAIPSVFIASTERTGATTFKKQLNLATSNLIDLLSQAHKEVLSA
jgi:hypothetical protein